MIEIRSNLSGAGQKHTVEALTSQRWMFQAMLQPEH